jgi:hypothetical protein
LRNKKSPVRAISKIWLALLPLLGLAMLAGIVYSLSRQLVEGVLRMISQTKLTRSTGQVFGKDTIKLDLPVQQAEGKKLGQDY